MRLWSALSVTAIMMLAVHTPAGAVSSEVDVLLNKLVERGVLKAPDAADIRHEIDVEQTTRAPSAAADNAENRLSRLEKDVKDKSVVHVGHGTLKVGGLLQGWVFHDGSANDGFRIRRAEIKLTGDILGDDRFKYTVLFDPSQVQEDNGRRSILKDAYFLLDHIPYLPHHTFTIGQFKPPRTEEGTRSSALLDFAERSIIAQTFGDQRDLGAMVTGDWPILTYQLGVFNGAQNQLPRQDQKDLVGRVVVRPLKLAARFMELPNLGELELGISGEHRPNSGIVLPKKRLGYEARYAYKNVSLKWEYMTGEDTSSALSTTGNTSVGTGWYAQAGYLLAPWLPNVQLVGRLEAWDPNANAARDAEHDVTLGFNYFLDKHNAKWQLNWVHKEFQNDKIDNQFISAFQVAF